MATTPLPVLSTATFGNDRKLIDVYRPGDVPQDLLPVVLMWHGLGPDERDVLRPLAEETAKRGAIVYASDWRSDASDGGRGHLLESIRFVRADAASRGGDAGRFVLAGWSAGAGAAMGVALRPELVDGWKPSAVVGIAGHYGLPARTTGDTPLDDLTRSSARPVPVRLVHGSGDVVLDAQNSRDFLAALEGASWRAHLDEVATDHAGVIMTEYDPMLERCVRTSSEAALRGGRTTARSILHAAGNC
ncbi:alpha/beta hydrolase fold domain-containing protein [Streptomyces sp. NPDC101227]|uniref:alpha/beta hydrolase fold domain-containing protein n=1 Tax=Streptomyces sp. NPDC101227 TaxID=3366136 RepID=UPI00380578C9